MARRLMAGNARYGLQGEKGMSDRWQYVVGGIISLVLAMGYLTLTDETSSDRAHKAPASVALDQTQNAPSPDALSGTELDALSAETPSSTVTPSAPIDSIDAALTPAAVSLLTEAGLNDNLDPSAVSALPASALEAVGQVAVGQAAVADDQANSE
jgi:hypothetical protein